MTERAAGNGHSWLWASHIRTKQSKWLEQNLQDMEDKVEYVLNLIQSKDGDSFARRAEMYYKHRPEVINFVEETVRGYRSLAQRYDKLSTELQKANTTIAAICPEKVTYEDDDDYTLGPSNLPKRVPKKQSKIPKPPKPPGKGVLNKYSNTKRDKQLLDDAKAKLQTLKHKFNLEDQTKNNGGDYDHDHDHQLGDAIDTLVNKMISLETSIASQTSFTNDLTRQNLELQQQIQKLQAENAALVNDQNKVKELDKKAVNRDEVSWIQMLLNGLEDKSEILLEEYVSILKSYRDSKKTLTAMKSAISKRDKSIQLLTQKLKLLQERFGEDKVVVSPINSLDDLQVVVSACDHGKHRTEIDAVLDRNLDLWLTFSGLFAKVYKFKKQVEDLQEEVTRVKFEKSCSSDLISDVRPIYKQLKEMNSKVTVWIQQSRSVKDELDTINARLLSIEEGIKFSTHDAAKLEGEILNMKQENNKVDEQLEAGLNVAIVLKHEIEQTLERLEMEFGLSVNQNQPLIKGKASKKRVVSLTSLLFGGKSKKQKFNLFSCLGHHHKRTRSI